MKRRFFEHSSILPCVPSASRLATEQPRARSARAINTLTERLREAIASAPSDDVRASLRRSMRQLEDVSALHGQAALYESIAAICATLQLVQDSFPGPMQRAVMDGKEVPLAALDAEVTRMLAARARMSAPPRFDHGVAYRKTRMTQSRIAARIERALACHPW